MRREEWWHFGGEGTELEVSDLLGGLVRGLQPDYVVEAGTGVGQTAQRIGEALKQNQHGFLDTVEQDPIKSEFAMKACQGLPVMVHNVVLRKFEPREPVDFAFINTEPNLLQEDFWCLQNHLHVDSIVAFQGVGYDDTHHALIDGLADQHLIRPVYLPTSKGLAIAQVL